MGGLFVLEVIANRVALSRREEAHPQGWLGWLGSEDPGDIPDRGWNARDEPTDEEEGRA